MYTSGTHAFSEAKNETWYHWFRVFIFFWCWWHTRHTDLDRYRLFIQLIWWRHRFWPFYRLKWEKWILHQRIYRLSWRRYNRPIQPGYVKTWRIFFRRSSSNRFCSFENQKKKTLISNSPPHIPYIENVLFMEKFVILPLLYIKSEKNTHNLMRKSNEISN